jgi:hypothetical protein
MRGKARAHRMPGVFVCLAALLAAALLAACNAGSSGGSSTKQAVVDYSDPDLMWHLVNDLVELNYYNVQPDTSPLTLLTSVAGGAANVGACLGYLGIPSGTYAVTGTDANSTPTTPYAPPISPNITFAYTDCQTSDPAKGLSLTITGGSIVMAGVDDFSGPSGTWSMTYTSSDLAFTGTVDGVAKSNGSAPCTLNASEFHNAATKGYSLSGKLCGRNITAADAGPSSPFGTAP